MHRIVTGYEAGRPVNLEQILQHELMPVLVSIVEMNGSLKTGNNSLFAKVLTSNVDCKQSFSLNGDSALIIDGITLVNSLGTPPWNNLNNSKHLVNEHMTKTFGASEKTLC